MKSTFLAPTFFALVYLSTGCWGQSDDGLSGNELDIIMSVVEENANPDDVINRIALPPTAPPTVPEPQIELVQPPLERVQNISDEVVEEATSTVTETINDALSSGDLEAIPKDITDALPKEVIDDLIDDLEEIVPLDDNTLDSVEAISESISENAIDDSLNEIALPIDDAPVDELIDDIDSSTLQQLDREVDQIDAAEDLLNNLTPDR